MAPRKTKEKVPETVRAYKKWRNAHYALSAAKYPTVMVPFAVELGVNWNQWFPEGGNHTSVSIGLAMAIMTTVLSVLAVAKKDTDFMKKIGAFVSVGIAFLAWGAVCVFLSSVLLELGKMLCFCGAGILAAAVEDSVDSNVVKEKYQFMKKLADENGLTNSGAWKEQAQAQAVKDGEERRKVRYVPHD